MGAYASVSAKSQVRPVYGWGLRPNRRAAQSGWFGSACVATPRVEGATTEGAGRVRGAPFVLGVKSLVSADSCAPRGVPNRAAEVAGESPEGCLSGVPKSNWGTP